MLKSIYNMLNAFHSNSILYCHWKSNEHLDEALNGDTDLDMLFLPYQSVKINEILNVCNLKRFRATPLMQYNAIEDYIGLDEDTGKIWHLHLHYRLTLGEKHLKGYTVPWGETFIKNRLFLEDKKVYVMAPDDEYFLFLLRLSLKYRWRDYYRKLNSDDIRERDWLLERISKKNVISRASQFLGPQCAEVYSVLLSCSIINHRQLIKLCQVSRRYMVIFTGHNRIESFILRTIRELFWLMGGIVRRLNIGFTKPQRRISPSGGSLITLLGCDGAGKSTLLSCVRTEFKKKIDVYTIYMGSGDGSCSIFRLPMRLIAKRIGGKGLGRRLESNEVGLKQISFKTKIYRAAKIMWAIALAAEKKKKLHKIVKAKNNGCLVLSDRYPQVDTSGYGDGPLLTKYLNRKGLLQRIAQWEFHIYRSAYINPPDLIVHLNVPTELAMSRKPEMTREEITAKKAAIKKLSYSSPIIEVDTSSSLERSFSEVMKLIWKTI